MANETHKKLNYTYDQINDFLSRATHLPGNEEHERLVADEKLQEQINTTDSNLSNEITRAKETEETIKSDYMKLDREEEVAGKKIFKGKIEVAESTSKGDEFLFSGIKEASYNADRPV